MRVGLVSSVSFSKNKTSFKGYSVDVESGPTPEGIGPSLRILDPYGQGYYREGMYGRGDMVWPEALKKCGSWHKYSSVENGKGSSKKIYFADPNENVSDEIKKKHFKIIYDHEPPVPSLEDLSKNYIFKFDPKGFEKEFDEIFDYYERVIAADRRELGKLNLRLADEMDNLRKSKTFAKQNGHDDAKSAYFAKENSDKIRYTNEKIDYYNQRISKTNEKKSNLLVYKSNVAQVREIFDEIKITKEDIKSKERLVRAVEGKLTREDYAMQIEYGPDKSILNSMKHTESEIKKCDASIASITSYKEYKKNDLQKHNITETEKEDINKKLKELDSEIRDVTEKKQKLQQEYAGDKKKYDEYLEGYKDALVKLPELKKKLSELEEKSQKAYRDLGK